MRAQDKERGATLVEMAIVLPILLMLVIGLVEIGLAFRSYTTVSNAARDGSRVASLMGNDPTADCEIVSAVAAATTIAMDITDLDRIEVYKADTNGNQIPSKTNTYTYLAGDPLDCTSWMSTVGWDPAVRNTIVGTTPLDIAGVRVVADHDWFSGMIPFNGTIEINETTLSRLEPEAYE